MGDRWTAQKLRVPRSDRGQPTLHATRFPDRLLHRAPMDRAIGEARIRQSDIAEAVQVTRRAVQLSTERLRSLGHPGQCGYEGGIVRLISATSAAEVNDSRAINSIVGQF
jgi:hypothetical protein